MTSPMKSKSSGKRKDFQVIQLSPAFSLSSGPQDQSEAWSELLQKVTTASCVEDQMDVIKVLSCYLISHDKENIQTLDMNYVSLAVDLYLSAPLKHPAKCALTKTFNSIKYNAKDATITSLKEGLHHHIKGAMKITDPTEMTMVASVLLGCYESLQIGPEILDSIVLNVMNYLDSVLYLCQSFLSSSNTPVVKVEVSKVAHTFSRIIIFALHRTKTLMLKDCELGKFTLDNILKTALQLMNSSEVPLDTRTNLGFVIVLILECLEGSNGWMQLLADEKTMAIGDELSLLCICSGLLSGLKSDQFELVHNSREKRIIACLLDIALLVNEQSIQESNVVLALWRVVQQWTRALALNPNLVAWLDVAQVENLMKHLWGLLDHYMDSVRHLGRGILENIMQLKDSFLLIGIDLGDSMADAVLHTPETKRSRYVILSIMTAHLNTSEIIRKMPNVINNLLTAMQYPTMSSHVSGAFVAMATADFKSLPYSEWCKMWVGPLFDVMQNPKTSDVSALEEALSKLIKLCPAIINEVLPDIDKKSKIDLPKLRVLLTCMKIGRKLGVLSTKCKEDDSLWMGTLPVTVLQSTLCHECDEIRISALALIVETNRSTETLCQMDFLLLKLFLEYNVNCEVPSFRQQALAFVSKLLNRMKDSAHTLTRPTKQKQGADNQNEIILQHYNNFVFWMVTFFFDNLRIGSNNSRRTCSLKVLRLMFDILKYDPLLTNKECQQKIWSKYNAVTLLTVILDDLFEENKAMATKILVLFPGNTMDLHDSSRLFKLFQRGSALASSVHPADCISAAYLVELCCNFSNDSEFDVQPLSVFDAITYLKDQLQKESVVAQQDILKAASGGPMYGSLFCIRHLLQLVPDLSKVQGKHAWQSLIKDLIELSFKVNSIVSPIVNSSSPEGHLPMDFNEGSSLLESNTSDTHSRLKVTAQMVLLCAWRTVKEVSLLLGKLCDCCPILPDANGILTEEQILAIGVHLTTLLEETKHRGAFEQAYVGFSLLAARLWRHDKKSLQELPRQWLNELMIAIQSNDLSVSKLCATRRSAGVPFLVQALVSAEPQTGAGLQSLQWAMSQLLSCAGDEGRHVECHTHALNILRALFRHAPLAEHVAPYISEGVVVAISGFRGKTWAERNSATLLFSSLMTRIFGVRRSREELSSRNKMTGRVFFHRYPELYEFLLTELKHAVKTLNSGDVADLAILHPILLLIGRLYPSSLEGTDTTMQMNTFVPLVRECASNSILKTRLLAAKAVVPLITANVFVKYVDDLVKQTESTCSENLAHGLALQIVHLLSDTSTLNDDELIALADHLETWILKILRRMSTFCSNPLNEVLLQVFEVIISNWHGSVSHSVWMNVKQKLTNHILLSKAGDIVEHKLTLGRSILEVRATRVLLQLLILGQENDSEAIVLELLRHSHYEVVQETLVVLERLLRADCQDMSLETEDIIPDVIKGDKHWLERLNASALLAFRTMFCESNILGTALASLVCADNAMSGRLALRVLVHVAPSSWCSKIDISQLLQWCNSPHEGMSCAAFACFSSHLKYLTQLNETIPDYCEDGCRLIKSFCSVDTGVISRMIAVNFLLDHREALERKYQFLSDETVCDLWICAMKVVCDDDSRVRARAALLCKVEFPLVPQKSLEILLDEFIALMDNAPNRALATLLSLALGPLPDPSSFECDEERVFEKGETNLFIEHEALTDLTSKYISQYVSKNTNLFVLDWNWVWISIGGSGKEIITDDQSLFSAIRSHNTTGFCFHTGCHLPPPMVCSLRRLYKIELTCSEKNNDFPSDFNKFLGETHVCL